MLCLLSLSSALWVTHFDTVVMGHTLKIAYDIVEPVNLRILFKSGRFEMLLFNMHTALCLHIMHVLYTHIVLPKILNFLYSSTFF